VFFHVSNGGIKSSTTRDFLNSKFIELKPVLLTQYYKKEKITTLNDYSNTYTSITSWQGLARL